MKKNVLTQNVMVLFRLLPVILILVLAASGCSRRGQWSTVIPGRAAGVSDGSLAGTDRQGGRNPNGDGFNVPPINNGGNNPGANVTPIPDVTSGAIPTDPTGLGRNKFDETIADASKFAAQTVYFDLDKANIKSGEVEKIRTVASHLKANPTHLLEVDGHCDERGTEEYNRSLGERRAQGIREFLAREGVDAGRVRTVSFGEDKPADSGHNEAAWSKNRRGDFILLTPR